MSSATLWLMQPVDSDSQMPGLKLLIGEDQLRERVGGLAGEIAARHRGGELVIVAMLKGSFVFLADLIRLMHGYDIRLTLDFMTVSSYGSGTESQGHIDMRRDLTACVTNRSVLVVDDILDTGRTLDFVCAHIRGMGPAELKTCVLFDKPDGRTVPFKADYVGFVVPDCFVVGYGLDYNGLYRELPHLCALSVGDELPR